MTSLTKKPHPQAKKIFSSAIYLTCRSVWAVEQLSSAFGGGSKASVMQPKTAVFLQKSPKLARCQSVKLDDIYSLELGKIMHKFHSGNLPDNFNHLFTPVNQVHCHATPSATRGAYFWQMAHTKYRKRFLRHLGPKIWDKIDSSLHDSSQLTFQKQYRDVLISAYDDK